MTQHIETTKHTSGPWTVEWFSGPNAASYVQDIKLQNVAIVPGNDIFPGSPQSNARLIAAAPELLEACTVALLDESTSSTVCQVLRDAITKATQQ